MRSVGCYHNYSNYICHNVAALSICGEVLEIISRKMENILTNSGLIHIREQIFGYFDQKTLKNCREAFAQKYGEDWDLWLERLILVQCIFEFGDKEILLAEQTKWRYGRLLSRTILRDVVPGWDKAVKKFVKMASLKVCGQDCMNPFPGSLLFFAPDELSVFS